MYAETATNSIVTNAGVYSIKNNKWKVEPKRIDTLIDDNLVAKKANVLKYQIDNIINHNIDDLKSIHKIKSSIKQMRSTGIDQGGEYSIENLAFKLLRDDGYLEKLSNYEDNLIDTQLSLK